MKQFLYKTSPNVSKSHVSKSQDLKVPKVPNFPRLKVWGGTLEHAWPTRPAYNAADVYW